MIFRAKLHDAGRAEEIRTLFVIWTRLSQYIQQQKADGFSRRQAIKWQKNIKKNIKHKQHIHFVNPSWFVCASIAALYTVRQKSSIQIYCCSNQMKSINIYACCNDGSTIAIKRIDALTNGPRKQMHTIKQNGPQVIQLTKYD